MSNIYIYIYFDFSTTLNASLPYVHFSIGIYSSFMCSYFSFVRMLVSILFVVSILV